MHAYFCQGKSAGGEGRHGRVGRRKREKKRRTIEEGERKGTNQKKEEHSTYKTRHPLLPHPRLRHPPPPFGPAPPPAPPLSETAGDMGAQQGKEAGSASTPGGGSVMRVTPLTPVPGEEGPPPPSGSQPPRQSRIKGLKPRQGRSSGSSGHASLDPHAYRSRSPGNKMFEPGRINQNAFIIDLSSQYTIWPSLI